MEDKIFEAREVLTLTAQNCLNQSNRMGNQHTTGNKQNHGESCWWWAGKTVAVRACCSSSLSQKVSATVSLPPSPFLLSSESSQTQIFDPCQFWRLFPSQLPGRDGNGERTQQGCDNVNRKTSHSWALPPALCCSALSCLTPSHLQNLKQFKTL